MEEASHQSVPVKVPPLTVKVEFSSISTELLSVDLKVPFSMVTVLEPLVLVEMPL